MLLITPAEVIAMAFLPREAISTSSIRPLKIDIAQQQFILPRFGEQMFEQFGEALYLEFVENYIKPALAHYIRAAVIDEISIQVGDNGAIVYDSQSATDKSSQSESQSTQSSKTTEEISSDGEKHQSESEELSTNRNHNSEQVGEAYTPIVASNCPIECDDIILTQTTQSTESSYSEFDELNSEISNSETQKNENGTTNQTVEQNESSVKYRCATGVERKLLSSRAMSDANVLIAKAVRFVERNPDQFPLYEKNNLSSRFFF